MLLVVVNIYCAEFEQNVPFSLLIYVFMYSLIHLRTCIRIVFQASLNPFRVSVTAGAILISEG
jgi:hypothetical protein